MNAERGAMSAEVRELTRDSYKELVIESRLPAVVDFWGPRCAPCLALEPTFLEIAGEFAGEMGFFRVEAPKNRMVCVDAKVMSLPTFVCVNDGVEAGRLTGDVSPAELRRWVREQRDQAKGGR
jgi:thioredoxin 1